MFSDFDCKNLYKLDDTPIELDMNINNLYNNDYIDVDDIVNVDDIIDVDDVDDADDIVDAEENMYVSDFVESCIVEEKETEETEKKKRFINIRPRPRTRTGTRSGTRSGTRVGTRASKSKTILLKSVKLISNYDETDILPKNHTRSRGRGRTLQLLEMSPEEKWAEKKAMMEINRLSAKKCREKKKKYVSDLECKLINYETKFILQKKEKETLIDEINKLKRLLNQ